MSARVGKKINPGVELTRKNIFWLEIKKMINAYVHGFLEMYFYLHCPVGGFLRENSPFKNLMNAKYYVPVRILSSKLWHNTSVLRALSLWPRSFQELHSRNQWSTEVLEENLLHASQLVRAHGGILSTRTIFQLAVGGAILFLKKLIFENTFAESFYAS